MDYEQTKFKLDQPIYGLKMLRLHLDDSAGQYYDIFLEPPDKIVKISDNEVHAIYGAYVQTVTADGEGDERYNFKSTVSAS